MPPKSELSVTPVSNKRSRAQLWVAEPPITGLYARLCLKMSCRMVTVQGPATGSTLYIWTSSTTFCTLPALCNLMVTEWVLHLQGLSKFGKEEGKEVRMFFRAFTEKKEVMHEQSFNYVRWWPLAWREPENSISFQLSVKKKQIKKFYWPLREPGDSVQLSMIDSMLWTNRNRRQLPGIFRKTW